MEFHISRSIRDKLHLDDLLFSYTGNVIFADVAASRRLAQKLTSAREATTARQASAPQAATHPAQPAETTGPVNAGALFAMGLIDELNHALIARYRKEIDPAVFTEALSWCTAQLAPAQLDDLLLAFTTQFPNVAVYRGQLTAAQWLAALTTTDGDTLPNREAALEELLLLWLANRNPAFRPFRELFDDSGLQRSTAYTSATASFPGYFATRPPLSPQAGTLLDALQAPFLASPDSLTGQLDFIRDQWTPFLGQDLHSVLLAIDVLREEDIAIWMRFHPAAPDNFRHAAPGFGAEGFAGDEFIGFEGEWETGPDGQRRRRTPTESYAAGYQAPLNEYEAFSADQAWMPNVVLIAKSTYVWLEQLSKKYGRHIHRLDHVPDEELQLLATRGITGLWLIGLWERSVASRTIKHLRGHSDAVASAYSLKDYNIAHDLGGNYAYEHLRDRAAAFGLRLASDMVPNHMGIDSPWVIEHPDWFISRHESPFPSYSFNGPDLSTDPRVEIKLEDHYFDQTDAAVAFRLHHYNGGATRFIYHGNDGTTFAWNDTAQLDYSRSAVREHVIQVILHVARLFPIIRFDAAMVLAKRHVQRLWFPLPGAGGSIPSRAEDAMSQEAFDAIMPHEFWREVVDRVAVEVPGTLLLAEAFWMLEGYFVRTLGMHRVYNSAFMNMLRDEENAKYRSYLKKTIEFDPDILKRYVNFMSNPDERTTIDQFGSGDKCFGVATLMSTLPGLPMFGHGQIEGYTERYGMEFKQAKMDERPNEALVARHQREIAPLLHNRRIFAESTHFLLYDLWTPNGTVDENVFAYSNRSPGSESANANAHGHRTDGRSDDRSEDRSIVFYNNAYSNTQGTIHHAVPSFDKASAEMRQRSLAEGLALPGHHNLVIAWCDRTRGLHFLRRASDLRENGLSIELQGYQYAVLLDWRELISTAEQPWDRLCDSLQGVGVTDLDEALHQLRLQPVHQALRNALSWQNVHAFAEHAQLLADTAQPDALTPQPTQQALQASDLSPAANTPTATGASAPQGDAPFLTAAHHFHTQASPHLPTSQPGDAFAQTLHTLTASALQLPTLARELTPAWPAEVRHLLPGIAPSDPPEAIWAPVLAWLLLKSLPLPGPGEVPLEAFDKLRLRSALAESFASLGMDDDAKWRAAARVRVLLAFDPSTAAHSTAFWFNPDVSWLAGVNESGSITYLNKELFESLLSWLQLPALLAATPQTLPTLEASLIEDLHRASRAGYKLDAFLDPPAPPDAPKPVNPPNPLTPTFKSK